MAQPRLESFTRRTLLLKHETTEGVDALPVPGTDAIRLFDGTGSTQITPIERNADKPHFGANAFVAGTELATIGGTFELCPPPTPGGAATSDATAALLLLIAGMAVTKDSVAKVTRYSPISDNIPSATGHWNQSGVALRALGVRADISSLQMAIGERFTGSVQIQGEVSQVAAEANVAGTLDTTIPVVATKRNSELVVSSIGRGATASTDSTPLVDLHLRGKSLSVDFGNAIAHKEYTEFGVTGISGRAARFTLLIAKTDLTDDFDPFHLRRNGTIIELDWITWNDDSKDGLYSQLGVRGQIEGIEPTDIDGDFGFQITGRCIPSDSGNDEFFVAFGDDTP